MVLPVLSNFSFVHYVLFSLSIPRGFEVEDNKFDQDLQRLQRSSASEAFVDY